MLLFDFQRLTGSENFHCLLVSIFLSSTPKRKPSENFHCPLVSSLFAIDQSSINPLSCHSYIKNLSNMIFPMAETMLEEAIWILDIASFALKRIGKLTWWMPKSSNPPWGKRSNIQNSYIIFHNSLSHGKCLICLFWTKFLISYYEQKLWIKFWTWVVDMSCEQELWTIVLNKSCEQRLWTKILKKCCEQDLWEKNCKKLWAKFLVNKSFE